MPIYLWKATAKNGAFQKGDMVADHESTVLAKLKKQGYRNVVLRKKTRRGSFFRSDRIHKQDIVVYIRQLSVMVSAGLPLITCFTQVGRGSEKPIIHEISYRIRDSIELGLSLSSAMAKEPLLFDQFTVNLVQVAEKSGVLNAVLERLATYKEKAFMLEGKVKSALTYPVAVLIIAALILYLLMIKVVPVFVDLYKSFDVVLPAATQVVIAIADFTQSWWWAVLLGLIFLFKVLSFQYHRNGVFRYKVDGMILFLPYFGDILRKAAIARFSRSFSTMLTAGTPIMACLDTVAKTAGNLVIEKVLHDAEAAIREGRSLTDPLEESDIFPPLVTQMIFAGETAGNLDFMLNKVADFYDAEVDRAVDNLKALMEPLIILILGIMIGGIVVGMYLPMLQMGTFVG